MSKTKNEYTMLIYFFLTLLVLLAFWYFTKYKKELPTSSTSQPLEIDFSEQLKNLDIQVGVPVFIRIFQRRVYIGSVG